jgi:hypothetical protein
MLPEKPYSFELHMKRSWRALYEATDPRVRKHPITVTVFAPVGWVSTGPSIGGQIGCQNQSRLDRLPDQASAYFSALQVAQKQVAVLRVIFRWILLSTVW